MTGNVSIKRQYIPIVLTDNDTGEELLTLKFNPENPLLWGFMDRLRNIPDTPSTKENDTEVVKKVKENKMQAAFKELETCINGMFGKNAYQEMAEADVLSIKENLEAINGEMRRLFDEYVAEKKNVEKQTEKEAADFFVNKDEQTDNVAENVNAD